MQVLYCSIAAHCIARERHSIAPKGTCVHTLTHATSATASLLPFIASMHC